MGQVCHFFLWGFAETAAQDGEEPGAPEAGRTSLQTTAIILALASALFLAALDVTIVTVAIPTIALEFHSTAGYTWIGSAYMLATAAAAPMWGKISDIWGRKPIMLIAVAVFWIGSLLSAVSKGMGMLIVARAVQGVGGGGIVILVNVCISDLFSMRKRGVYFGAMGMVWAVASAVGPILGGVFTSNVTWRWCFYINLPISGVGMVVLAYVLKLHNPRTPMRQGLKAVDWLGSLTVVGATLMIMLGLELGGVTHPWSSPTVICLLVFGVVTGALFVLIEWKFAEFPLVPMHLFRHWASAASLLVGALHGFVFISGSYYLPLYFQAVIGASPLMSGVYVLPWVMSLSLVSAATGIVIKKSGKYLPPLIFGMAVMTLGFGLFIDLEPRANWTKIVLYQLVAGIGVGPLFQSPLIALQTTVSGRDMASATGTFAFVRQLFSAVSIVIGGVVFQNGMQKQYPDLLAQLGPEVAQLLSGSNAASSVGLVGELPPAQRAVARQAYFDSLRTMYIMYVAFSAVGLAVGCFVGSRPLSKDHTEHKTGLDAMRLNKQDGEGGMSSGASSGATLDEERGMLAKRATLTQVTNFGSNPSGVRMYIYVPNNLKTKPAIVTAIHYCSGTANAFYTGTPYATLAEKYGFIVIYPEAPNSGGCWDVSSPASLTHNGGGNSNSIANMVTYTISQYNADASRVFLVGTSSGAMMTNVMAATYPELFKAGSAYAGVPAGCFYTGTVAGWNSTCANGQSIATQAVWAQTALNMYPGYTGARPKMQIYHGSADTTIYPPNFNETLKQWAGVFGYTYGQPQQTIANTPASSWTEYIYGPNLVGVYGTGITHNIPIHGENDMAWFGISGSTTTSTSTSAAATTTSTTLTRSTTTTSSAAATSTASGGGCNSARWGQCAGIGWTGCKACESPYKCTYQNDWYSQCL
ncbi:major facilitator superfamily domain-containing protein [Staphylotrichum tortipilum]|uniref:Efflux pump dotC n=1 Tax=Staphylotrichum tortipilum TaxID=2831512 RepID=A0AAN6MTN4_9PEZI|nr:major facilitator superfamily domain-containing protein [Staphylotrichum longicolle]